MTEILRFGLDEYSQLDKPDGTPVKIHIEGKIVSRDGNGVDVEVSMKDIQTEKAVDKEYREMTKQPNIEGDTRDDSDDEVDW